MEIYKVNEQFETLCCIYPFKKGDYLSIYKQTSKNRLIVCREQGEYKGGLHKVKKTTFSRCCIKYGNKS